MSEPFNVATHFLDRNVAEGRADRRALVTPTETVSYGELAALTNRIGNVLRDPLGVRPQQRVLLVLADGPEFVASWYAALKIGAVTAEAYTFLPAKDYAYYLRYTEAAVAIVDDAALEAMRAGVEESGWEGTLLVVGAERAGLRPREAAFEALVAGAPTTLDPAPTTADDIAIWKFTTGSTGAPKACVHRMGTPRASHESYALGVLGLGEDDLILPVPKLFFGYARDLAALYPFGVGAAGLVFPDRTTPERLFELIATHRPTILVNVPTMMAAMVAHPDAAHADLGCLRLCTSAGEALPAELHRRWLDTFGVEVLEGIGSSEAYHIYVSNRPGRARAGSAGEAVPGYRARVVDPDGNDLPDGDTGRLWIEGPTAALEYHGAPERSAETFGPGLVRSGDLFVRDADGFFSYRGRADDMLKVGGIWVAPAEIENCLLGHPDVVECAVVGYEEDGLVRPRAHVVLRAGAQVAAEDLRAFARQRLSGHKQPRDIRFEAELPKTGSGKLDRRALKERSAA